MTVGRYRNGEIGELFINADKSGEQLEAVARDAAVLLSLALRHGVEISTIQRAVTRSVSGEPQAVVGAIVDRLAKEVVNAGKSADAQRDEPQERYEG